MDRVELAFRKFDANRDGFLSRAEFDEVRIKVNNHSPFLILIYLARQVNQKHQRERLQSTPITTISTIVLLVMSLGQFHLLLMTRL